MSTDHDFITLKEAAAEVRLSVSTLKRYIYLGHLRTYRTPGGRHRIRRSDLAALLGASPAAPVAEATALAPLDDLAEQVADRVNRVLRERVGRAEADIERLECSLDAITAALRRAAAQAPEPERREALPGGLEIKVLGPGCRACDQLAALVVEIARAVGLESDAISRVREVEEIAEYGPTPMPALVINNELVAAGRPPTRSRLTKMLQRYRSN
jgi:excisionase family DNA binding protein